VTRLPRCYVGEAQLIKLKMEEVYRGGLGSDDLEVGEEEVREVEWDLAEVATEETEQDHRNMEEGMDE